MPDAGRWTHRLSEVGLACALPLVERALGHRALRSLILQKIERRIVDEVRAAAGPGRPGRVLRDKVDVARAMVKSLERALARGQVCRPALRGILKTALANYLGELPDDGARAATKRFSERHQGHLPPSSLAIAPTGACNLRCEGCYASAERTSARLEWNVLERLIADAKRQWGLRFFTVLGGEPLVYRSQGKDIVDWVTKHDDCFFLIYTNGLLIDEGLAGRLARAGNVTLAISLEGFEARTDRRRGAGVFQGVLAAMGRLRQAGVLFGVSLTVTRDNAEEVLSDEFIDFFFEEQQATYGWLFQYMPIGRGYRLESLVTPQQRLWMWKRTWEIVRQRSIMLVDFWNCGSVSEGCVAAARPGGYLYVDWNGKVMPCVFNPYCGADIHAIYGRNGTLDNVYDLPYFAAIRRWQWEYGLGKKRPEEHGNWLLPCPLRDHYAAGRGLIDACHAEPQDQAAADALVDPAYAGGLHAYDRQLREVFDRVWEQKYLTEGQGPRPP